jgi:phosphatidylglycerophosphate synthase
MATTKLAYSVQDRSILLPYYKRMLVEPLVPLIPRNVDPNAITHGGHLINLLALLLMIWGAPRVDGGWLYALVPLLVHVWLWCDHADGGHARRVGKCSAKGEFLDHGLDLLNATYVICMTVAALGAPERWSACAVVAVTAAAAVIYWEQAETGVFQLGLMTQLESVFSLTGLLLVRAVWGVSALTRPSWGGVSLPVALLALVSAVASFGMLRAVMRVASAKGRLAPFLPQLLFGMIFVAVVSAGSVDVLPATFAGSSVFVYLGLRALEQRLQGQKPQVEWPVVFAALYLAGAALTQRLLVWPTQDAWKWTVPLGLTFAALGWRSARGALSAVTKLDRA